MSETHKDVISRVAKEGWNFRNAFVKFLIHPEPEYEDIPAMAYIFGAKPKKTGKYFCPDCGEYLTHVACSHFEQVVRDTLRREVIEPYIQQTCPDCHEPIEDKIIAQEVDHSDADIEWGKSTDDVNLDEQIPDVIEKRMYKPCECTFELGEEKIRWDLDKRKVEKEINLLRYDGPVFADSIASNSFIEN